MAKNKKEKEAVEVVKSPEEIAAEQAAEQAAKEQEAARIAAEQEAAEKAAAEQAAEREQHNDGTQQPSEEAPAAPKEPKRPAAPAAPAAPKEATLTGAKLVRVHTMEEIDCWIGGVHYSHREGKDVQLPADVAAILNSAHKVYRI